MWFPERPIPTNLVTGFLGTGKTTAIRELLAQRQTGERWSVLINEYGMVSIDQTMFDPAQSDVDIQELGGGCFCCTTAAEFAPALAQFILATRPDRLLIEPSGAGHPARVIDTLRGSRFRNAIELRATLCLVDPLDFENSRVTNREVFHDQLQMADVVVLNWSDKRSSEQIARCRAWVEQFDPPKLLIAETSQGVVKREWLDLTATVHRPPRFAGAHDQARPKTATGQITLDVIDEGPPLRLLAVPEPGQPLRLANEGLGHAACGWVFSPFDSFRRVRLFETLDGIAPVLRLKGVFQCDDDWWLVNRVRDEKTILRSAYRHDSRVEIIAEPGACDWMAIEHALLQCLSPR